MWKRPAPAACERTTAPGRAGARGRLARRPASAPAPRPPRRLRRQLRTAPRLAPFRTPSVAPLNRHGAGLPRTPTLAPAGAIVNGSAQPTGAKSHTWDARIVGRPAAGTPRLRRTRPVRHRIWYQRGVPAGGRRRMAGGPVRRACAARGGAAGWRCVWRRAEVAVRRSTAGATRRCRWHSAMAGRWLVGSAPVGVGSAQPVRSERRRFGAVLP
jgi:hypothetical protein